jgi:hypothetical protein
MAPLGLKAIPIGGTPAPVSSAYVKLPVPPIAVN